MMNVNYTYKPINHLVILYNMHSNICFVHPPSIYDFRTRDLKAGPISDVVPSTPVFEMYPMGFISMLSNLTKNGYDGRIANVASRMVLSKKFDPVKYLVNMDTDIYAIDLHWLPHVHGAFSIAGIIKREKPEAKIVLGGFSASYFSDEIMLKHNEIDFILKGDFQEYGVTKLAECIEDGRSLVTVPSLNYRVGTKIISNPQSNENNIHNIFLDYKILMKNAIKYHDVAGHLPYADWINNPEAVTIIEHGCQFNCAFCGGSNFTYKNNFFKTSPVYRDPVRIAEEIEMAQQVLGSPVFVAGDINQAGEKYYSAFFKEIKERDVDIPLLTEYFVPPPHDYFTKLSHTFSDFTAEISPESSSEKIRKFNGRSYSNKELEDSIDYASMEGCRKFDVYFTLGISHQDESALREDIEYARQMMIRHSGKEMNVYSFISPLTPFIDPGSLIYEKPEMYGFHITARSIDEYFDLLDRGKSWVDFLNYYNDWMDAGTIESLTYESEIEMMKTRMEVGITDKKRGEKIIENIRHYLNNDPYEKSEKPNSHLSYLNKDIEWSRKHKLTFDSFLIYWYKNLKSIEKELEK
jgi:B12-binding domain/radical SAM domain protein